MNLSNLTQGIEKILKEQKSQPHNVSTASALFQSRQKEEKREQECGSKYSNE